MNTCKTSYDSNYPMHGCDVNLDNSEILHTSNDSMVVLYLANTENGNVAYKIGSGDPDEMPVCEPSPVDKNLEMWLHGTSLSAVEFLELVDGNGLFS